jgi:hypothetical protein
MAGKQKRLPEVTVDEVQRLKALLQGRRFQAVSARSDTLAVEVIRRFLSTDWVDEHISTARGFLKADLSTLAVETQRMRRIMLAEMLFNFQKLQGFHNCLTELEAGNVESAYASLEMARILVTHATDSKLTLRFVTPSNIKRRDYDLSIRCGDGVRICAETKCKLEETEITLKTVKRTLSKAKRQLPKRAPGMIFLKVPRFWIDDPTFVGEMRKLAARMLVETSWIVSIKYYTSRIVEERDARGEYLSEIIGFDEYANPAHRFTKWRNRDWYMFPKNLPEAPLPTRDFNGQADW